MALLSAALLGACRYQPTPVVLQGTAADIAALAGNWDGEYYGDEGGRSGTITFKVVAGSDTTFGDVMMAPAMGQPVRAADVASKEHVMHSASPELLRITFVRVAGGLVEGALEPYIAPDCQCEVRTVFRGLVKGETIEGRFVTRGAMGLRQDGRWRVERTSNASVAQPST
jgi:hypothetical protein